MAIDAIRGKNVLVLMNCGTEGHVSNLDGPNLKRNLKAVSDQVLLPAIGKAFATADLNDINKILQDGGYNEDDMVNALLILQPRTGELSQNFIVNRNADNAFATVVKYYSRAKDLVRIVGYQISEETVILGFISSYTGGASIRVIRVKLRNSACKIIRIKESTIKTLSLTEKKLHYPYLLVGSMPLCSQNPTIKGKAEVESEFTKGKVQFDLVKQRVDTNRERELTLKGGLASEGSASLKPPLESGLVESRWKSLLTRRHESQFTQGSSLLSSCTKFYTGPHIYNTVTWPLDGSDVEVINGHLYSTGHQRLWHYVNGMFLDVSCLFGPGMVLYTTAITGTFYLKFTYGDHHVTLPIDGREAWNYGIMNKHGTFEYSQVGEAYLRAHEKWVMLDNCLGDYSEDGLCPRGHQAIPMGIDAVRLACETVSDYRGEIPVPKEVRESCAVLITYGCEAFKLNVVLDETVPSLRTDHYSERKGFIPTLGSSSPHLSPIMKRWSSFGEFKLHYCMWKLKDPTMNILPRFRKIPDVETTTENILDAVNVIPFNKISYIPGSNKRTWASFQVDPDAHLAEGRPHYLSQDFARRWPYNEKLSVRPSNRIINVGSNLKYAKRVLRLLRTVTK